MEAALKNLIEILPPPENPTGLDVDWAKFERVLGFQYPTTFKDFVAIYGASLFLNNYSHFYPAGCTVNDVETFFETVSSKFSLLVDYDLYDNDLYDNDYKPLKVKMYPEMGGLFPFMCDYSSYEYFWQTGNTDSNKWPIVCWQTGVLTGLEFASLAELLLDDIDHWKKEEPERLCVERWSGPTQPPLTSAEIDDPASAFESAIQIGHKTLLSKISIAKAVMDERGGIDFKCS